MIFPNLYTDVHIFCYSFQTVSQQRNTRDKWGLYKPSVKEKEKKGMEEKEGRRKKSASKSSLVKLIWLAVDGNHIKKIC